MRKYISFFIILTLVFIVGCSNASPEESSSSTESPSTTESATKEPVAESTEATSEEAEASAETTEVTAEGQLELTLEELADYDGTDGKPAYIAVDGIIYDVTNSGPWSKGTHNGYSAGKDLTKEIKEVSPHGVSKLGNVEIVGILVTK